MTDTKELAVLKGQVTRLESQTQAVTISNAEEMTNAIDLVKRLKETGSAIKSKKESITKPLNEALKQARALFAPIEEQFESAERILKGKILAYESEVSKKAQEQEQKIADRVEKGTLRIETAGKKMDEIERVDKTVQGERGEASFKVVRKVRIIDMALLPREYMIPDEVRIRKDALNGVIIPGTEIYEEKVLAVK